MGGAVTVLCGNHLPYVDATAYSSCHNKDPPCLNARKNKIHPPERRSKGCQNFRPPGQTHGQHALFFQKPIFPKTSFLKNRFLKKTGFSKNQFFFLTVFQKPSFSKTRVFEKPGFSKNRFFKNPVFQKTGFFKKPSFSKKPSF